MGPRLCDRKSNAQRNEHESQQDYSLTARASKPTEERVSLASRHWDGTHILRHLVALLDCGARSDGFVPAFHVWILLQVDGLPFETGDPRPDRDVGNGILVGDELAIFETSIEHLIKPLPFFQVTLLGVRRFTL